MTKKPRVYLYDSTLRDGAQTSTVNFSVKDKIEIAEMLDGLGIDYIEGGCTELITLMMNFLKIFLN